MPHRIVIASTAGHILDGGVFAASFGLIGASVAGIDLDSTITVLASLSGLMIAAGRTAVYLATAYKTMREADMLKNEEE